jgi:DNA-binding GntR family transcriptional regulator
LIDQMRRYRSPSADLRGGLERSIEEHEEILNAVRAGDVDEAVRRVSEHVQVPQRLLESAPHAIVQPRIAEASAR